MHSDDSLGIANNGGGWGKRPADPDLDRADEPNSAAQNEGVEDTPEPDDLQ